MSGSGAPGAMDGAYWTQRGGENWAQVQRLMDRLNRPIAEAVIDAAYPGPGKRVLDVGCGGGGTTLLMAQRLGPDGHCVGLDISERLIAMAREAAEGPPARTEFLVADAQTYPFEDGAFDAIMSRYGVMFFDDPDAAFANLRRALKPDGRMAFACWRPPADNPFAQIPLQTAAPLLSQPPPPPSEGPGRFAFADPDKVRGILERSGWRDIAIVPLDGDSPVSLDELMSISVDLGMLGPLMAKETPQVREQATQAIRARLAEHERDGVIPMTAACWLVTARP